MNERITIVVPVYNAQKTLESCINSVIKQSFQTWHLVLVDDGSKDASGRICDEYSGKDSRIKVLHQENKGSFETREAGIQQALNIHDGYITFLDADDILPKGALETYIDLSRQYNADIVCGRMKRFWKGITIKDTFVPKCFQIDSPKMYTHDEFISELSLSFFGITNYPVSLCAKMFKMSLFEKTGSPQKVTQFFGDDLIRTLPLSLAAERILITNNVVYKYRIGGGTTKFNPHYMEDFIRLYQYKKPFVEKYQVSHDAYKYMDIEIINCFRSYLIMCKETGGMAEKDMYKEIIKYSNNTILMSALPNNNNIFSRLLNTKNINGIVDSVNQDVKRNRYKNIIKTILYSI